MTAFDKKVNQIAAKAAQREKAVQWNAVEVFNEIYA